ncbi:MAG: biotin--[acetyl-CoA-carboxylase] ligase [Runella slithyformis]|nr:MAG: biotin--[acetyl-CoA-carboxylase] ligase [Runella slithyformis]
MHKIRPKTLFVGKKSIYLPTCQSTNDEAALLLRQQPVEEGTLIITDHQLAGRGQRGNAWQAQAGQNLTFSIVLKPTFLTATEQFRLSVAISLGLWAGLESILPGKLKIKWPNDLYFSDQKLGGILIENSLQGPRLEHAIVGIGLNVNQLDFENPHAASLASLTHQTYDLEAVLVELLVKIEESYLLLRNGHYNQLKMRYLRNLYRYQEKHLFCQNDTTFEGIIVGVSEEGKLAVQVNNDLKYFELKEISHLI